MSDAEIVRCLTAVGIVNPEQRMRDYPHQLSGGMQQRAMIAMALSCRPALLVADEPTTALDVTIQAQILKELKRLRAEFGMALILITHNIAIISGLCDRVAVMFRGEIVEYGETESVLTNPQHPYTKALISCVPGSARKKSDSKPSNTIGWSRHEFFQVVVVSWSRFCQSPLEQPATKGGEIIMKFVKDLRCGRTCGSQFEFGACAHKSQAAPPPPPHRGHVQISQFQGRAGVDPARPYAERAAHMRVAGRIKSPGQFRRARNPDARRGFNLCSSSPGGEKENARSRHKSRPWWPR